MTASRLLLTMMLGMCVARPSEAQRLAPAAPVALRQADMPFVAVVERPGAPLAVRAASADTIPVPEREISQIGTIIGGVGGGLVGAALGLAIGAGSAEGCHGDMCGLGNVVLGLAIGESLGVGIGSHLGSRSPHHGNVVLTTLTSAAILVGGTMLGAAMQQGGAIMIPLTPAMQLAAAWAIESH